MFSSCSFTCKPSEPFAPMGFQDACEYSDSCAFDSGKTCTMTGNRPGNCVLNGLCCPSFSADESRMKNVGLPEGIIGNRFQQSIEYDEYE